MAGACSPNRIAATKMQLVIGCRMGCTLAATGCLMNRLTNDLFEARSLSRFPKTDIEVSSLFERQLYLQSRLPRKATR